MRKGRTEIILFFIHAGPDSFFSHKNLQKWGVIRNGFVNVTKQDLTSGSSASIPQEKYTKAREEPQEEVKLT